ncbi:MAG: alpha/beta hydrolase [Pseudomonadales bacterium]
MSDHLSESKSSISNLLADNLPAGVSSRRIGPINGLEFHILEAGDRSRPLLLLLHGFPELAFSWRKIMPRLAATGYHVVAPDQRGYGGTTGWQAGYDSDLAAFSLLSLANDAAGIVHALGHSRVAAVIGHDFGSPVAAWCGIAHPEMFPAVVLMSAPFQSQGAGNTKENTKKKAGSADVHAKLAQLVRPRKHYQLYYGTREANDDMLHARQGLKAFLRAYYHVKSADWPGNQPQPLTEVSAEQWATMPGYYVMDLEKDMAETVAEHMPSQHEIDACQWMTDRELDVYVSEFRRTGFQGGLQWYRARRISTPEQAAFVGRGLHQPVLFIGGVKDWGIYQTPGALESMAASCTDYRGSHLIEGAGHWVQQEQAEDTSRLIVDFMDSIAGDASS